MASCLIVVEGFYVGWMVVFAENTLEGRKIALEEVRSREKRDSRAKVMGEYVHSLDLGSGCTVF